MAQSLEQLLDSSIGTVERMRDVEIGTNFWSAIPEEFTHWIEEQRAAREACIFADQSYHMVDLYLEGPDAIELLSDLGVNSFESFRNGSPPKAKQLVACNADGYLLGDSILFYLEDETYLSVGHWNLQNWLLYNLETGDYDTTANVADDPVTEGPISAGRSYPDHDGPPEDFRFEIQGPNALDVMAEVVDHPLPDISFFQMDTIDIDGVELYVLAHGMSSVPGWEIFGPYEHHDRIKELILEAGEEYGIRHVGRKSYLSGTVPTGWFPVLVPAIYEREDMKEYREWLDADCYEANIGLNGSFDSLDIEDYYLDPYDVSYDHVVNFDHDFVGRQALEERRDNPGRTRVTYVWDDDDVFDVFGSLFDEGETYKMFDLPAGHNSKWESRFDAVTIDDEVVGLSKWCGYDYNQREFLSIGVIDVEHSDPGTEVTLTWGDVNPDKSHIERHVQKEMAAIVAPSPYFDEGRKDM